MDNPLTCESVSIWPIRFESVFFTFIFVESLMYLFFFHKLTLPRHRRLTDAVQPRIQAAMCHVVRDQRSCSYGVQ
jgi:hypothetical protein